MWRINDRLITRAYPEAEALMKFCNPTYHITTTPSLPGITAVAVTYDVNADGSGLSVTLRVMSRRLSLCIVCPHLFHLRHILVGFELETECLTWW